MIRGMYTSASGMLLEQARLDVISNNVASAGATGFKKDVPVTNSFPEMLIYRTRNPGFLWGSLEAQLGPVGTGAVVSESVPDMTKGPGKETGNPLDVLVPDDAFLVVMTATGERYTKNGNLTIGSDGRLMTQDGDPVLGEAGEIQLGEGKRAEISPEGAVLEDGNEVDRLRVVRFRDPVRLAKFSTTTFRQTEDSGNPEQVEAPSLKPGCIEMSNVNPVIEMVEMISVMRAYEANQRLLQSQDQTLDKAVNEIGRV
ncbi:MAG: flagellar hook-basal body protein [Firmicutes bacterium]|nr:flagellar hook-basal body protein [Bacillota bacterium]